MFLYDEEIALGLGPFPTRPSGFGKVALGVVAAEGVGCFRHGSGLLPPGCWLLPRRLLCRSLFGGGLSRGRLACRGCPNRVTKPQNSEQWPHSDGPFLPPHV